MYPKDKTPTISRGEVYFVYLDPVLGSEQGGTRPAVVLQNNTGNRNATTVIVAPVTSQSKPLLPTHVALPHIGGLRDGSVLLLEQIRTVDKQRVGTYVCTIGSFVMERVEDALLKSVGIKLDRKRGKAARKVRGVPVTISAGRVIAAGSVKKPGKNIVTLCPVCKNEYLDAGYALIKRNDSSSVKEMCGKCNFRTGFDYEVVEP
jgi:mRNA interferase MazF